MDIVFIVNKILSALTLAGDLILLGFLSLFIICYINKTSKKIIKHPIFLRVSKFSLHFALIVSLVATLGSLFYSEIAKYDPCKLCWFQRIFMYPQVFLLSLGILKKDKNITDYSILLSVIGGLIAVYHYYLQRGGASIFPCSAVGYSVSCSQNFVMEYGYITIPMMSLTAFLLMISFSIIHKIGLKDRSKKF